MNISTKLGVLLVGTLLCLSTSSYATVYLFNFDSPTGTLGTSQSYTNNFVSVTATGYNNNGTTTALFGKMDGGDENGLGIANGSDHEITTANFVQLNLSSLLDVDPQSLSFTIGSSTGEDAWKVYESNSAGVLGTLVASGNNENPQSITVPSAQYLSFQASAGNVLLSTITANTQVNTPEPMTILTLASGLALTAFAKKRKMIA